MLEAAARTLSPSHGPPTLNPDAVRTLAIAVLDTEAQAVMALRERITASFVRACSLMFDCRGRVVVLGMGKSGHIGGKIAATLASTGTPAFFVHPGEASHGDLGMITPGDVVLAISYSGETDEIVTIIPLIKRLGVSLIAMTGRPDSTLAREADANIDVSVAREACPLNLAPTASTTATLAMGDALAIALLEERGFSKEDFSRSHPKGTLGRRLLLHVGDIMVTGERIPQVTIGATGSDALLEMTRKGLGVTAVVDDDGRLVGIYTDGDLRRTLEHGVNLNHINISEVMTPEGITVLPTLLAAEALQIMQSRRINALPVVDAQGRLVGALNLHTLLDNGVA